MYLTASKRLSCRTSSINSCWRSLNSSELYNQKKKVKIPVSSYSYLIKTDFFLLGGKLLSILNGRSLGTFISSIVINNNLEKNFIVKVYLDLRLGDLCLEMTLHGLCNFANIISISRRDKSDRQTEIKSDKQTKN